MLYTDLTRRAMKLCFAAHKDQTDKSGLPYVFHPVHLAEQMPDEESTVVALLHDVVEDTPYTLEDLAQMGFPQGVLDALALLTHDRSVPYLDYVARLKPNPVARRVKLADLRHNSDRTRLCQIEEGDRRRMEKYAAAIQLLETNEKTEERIMNEVYEFLKSCQTYYLATVEGDQPRVRPFGTIDLFEGKLYIQTGAKKDVSKQIHANGKVEICAFDGSKWLRLAATAVADDNIEAQRHMLDAYPSLKAMYQPGDGNTEVFYLKDATATFSSFTEAPKTIRF